jgi:hypothetical protein
LSSYRVPLVWRGVTDCPRVASRSVVSAEYHQGPKYRVMGVPRLGCMEFTYTVEVFDGQEVVGKHACPTPRVTCAEVVADVAW